MGKIPHGENSAWGKFRTCPKKSGENSAPVPKNQGKIPHLSQKIRGKFRTSQIFSAFEAKGILGLRSPKDTHYNKATINDSADV